MSKITPEQRQKGFELSLAFYRNKISFSEAVEQLTSTGMKRGSAQDYIRYIKEYMQINHTPTRTMSEDTQTLFMKGVLEHLGKDALEQWAINDRKHFDYYEGVKNGRVVGRRENLEKFLKEHLNNKESSTGKMYAVIAENDESQWNDETGILYHFPNKYRKYLQSGTHVIYYKGALKNKEYSSKRLSDAPHYFGTAVIGKVYPDKESTKGDLFALITKYQKFEVPILAKNNSEYLESIPESRKSNYWRDGVRPIDKDTFFQIVNYVPNNITSNIDASFDYEEFNDTATGLESSSEGEKKERYVTFYERKPILRKQAIAIHGTKCHTCKFDFRKFYGDYAKGYIQIHHIVPLSELDDPKNVDPEKDLIPLCANCHAIIHRKKTKTLTITELQEMIANQNNEFIK